LPRCRAGAGVCASWRPREWRGERFNPAAVGQPLHWQWQLNYFIDQGRERLGDDQQATAMVDAAAALWSAIPQPE